MEYVPLSALQPGHLNQCISVRASRLWHYRGGLENGKVKNIHMVLIDEQGDSIYAIVPTDLVATNINSLHETGVYNIGPFDVSNDQICRNPVENPLVILFTQFTMVQPVFAPDDIFPAWTYTLTSFGNLPGPGDTPTRFIDVIGTIRAISNVATYNVPGRNVPTNKRQIVLTDNNGHEVKICLWGEAAFRFNGKVIHFLGQTEPAIVIFVGMTVHMSEGLRELAGTSACRWYINEDIEEINILRASLQPSFEPIDQIPAPRHLILQPQVLGQYPTRSISALLDHDFFQNQDGMFRCTVRIWRMTPGKQWWYPACKQCRRTTVPMASSAMEFDKYTCSDTDCTCTDANLEYRLHLLASDGTGEAEFRLFGRVAQDVVGLTARQTILNNYQSNDPITNLAVAATTIVHTPPELAAVISGSYQFILYVTSSSFNGNWASFNVHTVEAYYPPE